MEQIKKIRALGLMSGTSLDGIDVATITTDGIDVYEFGKAYTVPYSDELREDIRSILGKKPDCPENIQRIELVENKLTQFHAEVVNEYMSNYGDDIDIIGFHGHTIHHEPQNRYTHQIGNGQLLADLCKKNVVARFRNADVLSGGQGAPLVPVYHCALSNNMNKPLAILNIGGVANITWIGRNGEILAFDTGPGNAPINDWILKHSGEHMDYNGKLAALGKIDGKVLASLMRHKYFAIYPPKSIDRNIFNEKLEHLEGLSLEDGAATATAFAAEAVAYSCAMYLPEQPELMIVCGGGANNPTMMRFLRQRLDKVEIITAKENGWDSDALEAQAFAFLAARRLYGLPATYPTTTGTPEPIICGEIFAPK